jgi:hypothetical protein
MCCVLYFSILVGGAIKILSCFCLFFQKGIIPCCGFFHFVIGFCFCVLICLYILLLFLHTSLFFIVLLTLHGVFFYLSSSLLASLFAFFSFLKDCLLLLYCVLR